MAPLRYTIRILCRSVLGLLIFWATSPTALLARERATLADLEAHTSRYSGLEDLLADEAGLLQYRELLKSYMGYDDQFDASFEATIKQMKKLVNEIPGFSERMWALRVDQEIRIAGAETHYSGIVVEPREALMVYELFRSGYEAQAENLLGLSDEARSVELLRLERELVNELTKLSQEYPAIATKVDLTRSEKRQLQREEDLREKRQEYFNRKKELLHSSPFLNYFRYRLMNQEPWLDIYRRSFAESALEALSMISRLDGLASDWIKTELGKDLDGQIVAALADHSEPIHQYIRDEFEALLITKREFNSLVTPPVPDGPHDLNEFRRQRDEVYFKKRELLIRRPLVSILRLPVIEDDEARTLELARNTSDEFSLTPLRGLHSAFGGYLTKECVGGACTEDLTPRRWALASLEGVRVFAAEKDGQFNGVLRLVPVTITTENEASGKQTQTYEAVDMMIQNISATIQVQSDVTQEIVKYPLFDAILDRLQPAPSSLGFVAGNGLAISQNTGLARIQQSSPSVIQARTINSPYQLNVTDVEMQTKINALFSETPFGYNPGGMIYEGMPGDGSERYILTPRPQRPKLTQNDLEVMILKDVILGKEILNHEAFALAVENNVSLSKRLESYNFQHPLIGRAFQELMQTESEARISHIEKLFLQDENLFMNPLVGDTLMSLIANGKPRLLEGFAKMFERDPRLAENPELLQALLALIQAGDPQTLNHLAGMFQWNSRLAKNPKLIEPLLALIQSKNERVLERLKYMFKQNPELAENSLLTEALLKLIDSNETDVLLFLASIFKLEEHPELSERVLKLIQAKDAEAITWGTTMFIKDPELLEDPFFSEHALALIRSADLDTLDDFASIFLEEPQRIENPQALNTLIALIQSLDSDMMEMVANIFSDEPELTQVFWEEARSKLHEPLVRKALVRMFENERLRGWLFPMLQNTPEAQVPQELLVLAREEGHRVARQALIQQKNSGDGLTTSETKNPSSCSNFLQSLHLQQSASTNP